MILHHVHLVSSVTLSDGVWLHIRSHENEYIASDENPETIKARYISNRPEIVTIDVTPISRNKFEKSIIAEAIRQNKGKPICIDGINFDSAYFESLKTSGTTINPMTPIIEEIVDNSRLFYF